MTTAARAAEIISRAMLDPSFKAPESRAFTAAVALAKAGLLAPDLPPVTHRAGMGVAGTDFPMTSGRFARVNLPNGTEYLWTMFNPGGVTLIYNRGKSTDAKGREWPDTRDVYLTPDAAREIAYTLLAAANHAARQALDGAE